MTNGGTGARPQKDGLSATAFPSGVRGTPVEINETVAPLIFHRKEYRTDSGGAGLNRGGAGQVIEISSAINANLELLAAFDRIDFPARGREGGQNGGRGSLKLKSGKKLEGKGTQIIESGQTLIINTPGGAGHGNPTKRDRSKIEKDVLDQMVSLRAAKDIYGY